MSSAFKQVSKSTVLKVVMSPYLNRYQHGLAYVLIVLKTPSLPVSITPTILLNGLWVETDPHTILIVNLNTNNNNKEKCQS